MLNFGFIGLGQVGGVFSDETKQLGYSSLAINTASVDLNTLSTLSNDEKIHLYGYEGAGKDRSIGNEAFFTHEEKIKEKVIEIMKDCHVIFPVFALGGGSGSGMASSLCKMLTDTFPHKVISPILFLPHEKESIKSKMNTLESFSEISLNENLGAMFIFDNQKILDLNQSLNLREKFRQTRKDFLEMLHFFNKQTVLESDLSNLDKMDLLTTLSERGVALLSKIGIDENDLKDLERIENRLLHSFEYSPYVDCEIKNITKAALIVHLPANLTANLTVDAIFNKIDKPIEIFTGIFEKEERAKLHTLITGLRFPMKKLKEFEESIKMDEDRIYETIEQSRNQTFHVSKSWTEPLKRKKKLSI